MIPEKEKEKAPPTGQEDATDKSSAALPSHEPQIFQPSDLDPFDPENLRIDQSYLNQGAAKKLLTTIPVRKPHKQDFVRVHPGIEYRIPSALLEFEEDIYIVTPKFAAELVETEYFMANIYVCINRQKVLSLWPVKLPGPDGRQLEWHTSAQAAAELAMKRWVRVTSNRNLGAYEISEAIADYGEPEWPELPLKELLRIGFKNRIITDENHIVIQKLRGLT